MLCFYWKNCCSLSSNWVYTCSLSFLQEKHTFLGERSFRCQPRTSFLWKKLSHKSKCLYASFMVWSGSEAMGQCSLYFTFPEWENCPGPWVRKASAPCTGSRWGRLPHCSLCLDPSHQEPSRRVAAFCSLPTSQPGVLVGGSESWEGVPCWSIHIPDLSMEGSWASVPQTWVFLIWGIAGVFFYHFTSPGNGRNGAATSPNTFSGPGDPGLAKVWGAGKMGWLQTKRLYWLLSPRNIFVVEMSQKLFSFHCKKLMPTCGLSWKLWGW